MTGTTILHYRLLDKLGEGGMGVVYRAEDTKLQREVAIKFLPPRVAASEQERERFKVEAQAAAALNHPNIATIHAIEEHDGEMFIVMEYIEGRELHEIVREQHDVPLHDAVNYATQIASGLNAAHEKGVIHRDIKSSNVMVTADGQVKIMDFGLAKIRGGQHLTESGLTVGTVAYMSPEQARGEQVDHRTDIWSFGVLLYEMISGELPFKGDYEQAIIYSILNEDVPPISDTKGDVSAALEKIAIRCLEKDPVVRYQSFADLIADLADLQTPSHGRSRPTKRSHWPARRKGTALVTTILLSVVLLVFRYLYFGSSDETKAFVAVVAPFWGVDSEAAHAGRNMQALIERKLVELLGKHEDVNIIGKTVTAVPRSHKEARALGSESDATLVIWGEILAWMNEVEIQPYLTLLNDSEESQFTETAAPLQVSLIKPDQLSLQKTKAEEVGNLALQIAGRYYRNADPGRALTLFQSITPQSAESLSEQGWVYFDQQNWLQAEKRFEKALSLSPNDADLHAFLGQVHERQNKLNAALAGYKKAIELNPEYFGAYLQLGQIYFRQHKYCAALASYEKARELNPESYWPYYSMGRAYEQQGKFEQAVAAFRKASELAPENISPRIALASCYSRQGKVDSAETQYKTALKMAPGDTSFPSIHTALGDNYVRQKRYAKAKQAYRTAIELEPEDVRHHLALADLFAIQNKNEQALKKYQEAIELAPHDAGPHQALGRFYERRGEDSTAAQEFKKAAELTTDHALAHIDLSQAYHLQNKPEQARSAIDKAAKVAPDFWWYHVMIGQGYLRQGLEDSAVVQFQKALELSPGNSTVSQMLDSLRAQPDDTIKTEADSVQ